MDELLHGVSGVCAGANQTRPQRLYSPQNQYTAYPLHRVQKAQQALPKLRGFRREITARVVERIRREPGLQLQAMRQLLHALFE